MQDGSGAKVRHHGKDRKQENKKYNDCQGRHRNGGCISRAIRRHMC